MLRWPCRITLLNNLMPTEDAYSSGHLVLSHFGTCMCSNVETNLSWTCLVSGLLNFEHPSVLLFCIVAQGKKRNSKNVLNARQYTVNTWLYVLPIFTFEHLPVHLKWVSRITYWMQWNYICFQICFRGFYYAFFHAKHLKRILKTYVK